VTSNHFHESDQSSNTPMSLNTADCDTELIGLPEAAHQLGVHYMTAYRYVRTGRLPATIINGLWRVDPADIRSFIERGSGLVRVRGDARLRAAAHFEQRLIEGDEAGAWQLCDESLGSWATPVDLYDTLLLPALHSIGRRWQIGELPVADEHRAAAVVIRLMGRLGPHFVHPGRRRGTIVIGAPAGDHHSIPVMLIGDVLRDAGFCVVDLGADVPTPPFVEAARRSDRLVAVAIGATLAKNEDAVRDAVASLHDAVSDLAVMVGGLGLPSSAAARRVGADLWSGRNWESVVRAATDLEARIGLTRSTSFSPV
jgi:excisionase family DNA binding protein